MAKKVITESRTANYQSIDENAKITARVRSLGWFLTQAHHCSDKTKSFILTPRPGEPGLLYTKDIKDVERFLDEHEGKQLESKRQASRKVPEDPESGSKEEEAVEEYDDASEEE